jgi:hypothetical protein
MKSLPTLPTILAAAFLILQGGCATPLVPHADHDPAQNFSGYRTFAWIADDPMIAPPGDGARVSPLNRRRIEEAIEQTLAAKGFQKLRDGAEADFAVAYSVGARDRIDAHSFPEPYVGVWRWGRPYYGRGVDVDVYREGTLAIDVFDGRTHQPVWHGWASKRVTEHDVRRAAEQIPPAVAAILSNFPPR